jgi:hypothetical protein
MNTNKFKIGDVVVLRTKTYEYDNAKIIHQGENRRGETEQTEDSIFISPVMVVTMLKPYSEKKPTEKEQTTKEEDKIKVNRVTCTWFNKVENKYSERDFPEDVLELAKNTVFEFSYYKLVKDFGIMVFFWGAKSMIEKVNDFIIKQ